MLREASYLTISLLQSFFILPPFFFVLIGLHLSLIFDWFKTKDLQILMFNPFKPEFTIVIAIHYKTRIAVAILDL